jgi:hypothetical protein
VCGEQVLLCNLLGTQQLLLQEPLLLLLLLPLCMLCILKCIPILVRLLICHALRDGRGPGPVCPATVTQTLLLLLWPL